MAWMRVHDNFYNHEKFIGIKSGAGWLWIRGLAYCKSHNTDGVIPDAVVRRVLNGNPTQVKALVDAGLWHETQTETGKKGYVYNDYLDYQTSSAKDTEDKKNGAARTAKWRENQRGSDGISAENQRDSDGISAEYQPNSDTISEEYAENHHHPKRSDQQERGNVTPLEKRREEEIRRDETTAEAPGGGDDEQKTETRDGNTTTPSPSDSAPAPDNSASSSRNQEPVVDVSGTKKESNDFEPGSLDHLPYEERKKFILDMAAQRRGEHSA